jgi:hypothetical protein
MTMYEQKAWKEMMDWQRQMQRKPGFFNSLSKSLQNKINQYIPAKVHEAVTTAIKQMVRGVLFGATHSTSVPLAGVSFEERESAVLKRIAFYQKTAAIEGGVTGAGGILLGLADFPILLAIKIKLLFEIASLYGLDINDYRERVYLLHIFELAFSSDQHRKQVYLKMVDWRSKAQALPDDIHAFDWRSFQQEYRDYIDLAKMAQLIPLIGAPVGVVVNYRLLKKLGTIAVNAYRMRLLNI